MTVKVHRSEQRASLSKAYAVAAAMNEVLEKETGNRGYVEGITILGYEIDHVAFDKSTLLIDVIYRDDSQ